jgi:hypothetical protein
LLLDIVRVMVIQAFDIWTDDDAAEEAGGRLRLPAGWAGPEGPGIDARMWPRSPRTGQPMVHCFTLYLPETYRRRGPDLVAVAVYQWEDEAYAKGPTPAVSAVQAGLPLTVDQSTDPFWREFAQAQAHPQAQIADDGVASVLAMVWLNEQEYAGSRLSRPAATSMTDGERDNASWRAKHGLYGPLWLEVRDDPNAGIPPVGFPSSTDVYIDVADKYDIFHTEHLGGTDMCPDGIRDGVSPWYIEVSRLGGISFGGDQDISLDLEHRPFLGDWSTHVAIPAQSDGV